MFLNKIYSQITGSISCFKKSSSQSNQYTLSKYLGAKLFVNQSYKIEMKTPLSVILSLT